MKTTSKQTASLNQNEFTIQHFPTENKVLIKRPFLGRFDMLKSLQIVTGNILPLLKNLRNIPLFLSLQFLAISPAFAATHQSTSVATATSLTSGLLQNPTPIQSLLTYISSALRTTFNMTHGSSIAAAIALSCLCFKMVEFPLIYREM